MHQEMIHKKEEHKGSNIINNTKMTNFVFVTKETMKKHNPNSSQILDHPYKILTIRGSESEKNKFIV